VCERPRSFDNRKITSVIIIIIINRTRRFDCIQSSGGGYVLATRGVVVVFSSSDSATATGRPAQRTRIPVRGRVHCACACVCEPSVVTYDGPRHGEEEGKELLLRTRRPVPAAEAAGAPQKDARANGNVVCPRDRSSIYPNDNRLAIFRFVFPDRLSHSCRRRRNVLNLGRTVCWMPSFPGRGPLRRARQRSADGSQRD